MLRGIVFDLDGTLYRQRPLRKAMLWRLLRAYATRPLSLLRTLRVLGAYRQAQEHLRQSVAAPTARPDLAEAQLRLTCERTHAQPAFVAACVARWMDQEPLTILARYLQPGLLDFLRACQARGLRLGVLSDYPAEAKLRALGLGDRFDVVLAAQSPEVGVFKPHPRGLLLAAERLGVRPDECVYVGDRAEVDGPAAEAAGMPCFIVTSYPELHQLIWGHPGDQAPVGAAQPSLHRR
ncbi:MAG TPA: HAD family hydrolase [Ktedonobacterales bacterium]|nr:HAD family hydrolase [Ktedonobacterales bacterium]